MPFGKFLGCTIHELPDDYLEWLSSIELREPLRSAVDDELYARDYEAAQHTSQPQLDVHLARKIVDRGYKVLAKEHHPDLHGGDGRVMAQLNEAASWLRQQLTVLT